MSDPIDTTALRELLAKSGAESWTLEQTWPGVTGHTIIRFADDGLGFFQTKTEEQAVLIVAAVNVLPALLDELDACRAALRETTGAYGALKRELDAERERVRELEKRWRQACDAIASLTQERDAAIAWKEHGR